MQGKDFHDLPGGRIRQLRPSDLAAFSEHLIRLDAGSRRDRFNGAMNDSALASYAARCFSQGATVIGYVESGKVKGAAELHERADLEPPTGEIAFSVERGLQHRGIGSELFKRLIGHALALGYEQLRVMTHPDNQAMRGLAKKFGASLQFRGSETVGTIDLSGMRMSVVTQLSKGVLIEATV
mgnify:CR=1 FL=1